MVDWLSGLPWIYLPMVLAHELPQWLVSCLALRLALWLALLAVAPLRTPPLRIALSIDIQVVAFPLLYECVCVCVCVMIASKAAEFGRPCRHLFTTYSPLAAFALALRYLNDNPAIGTRGEGGAESGAKELFRALGANQHLVAVSMPNCGIGDGAAEVLESLLLDGRVNLVELNLKDNPISQPFKDRLREASHGHVQNLNL